MSGSPAKLMMRSICLASVAVIGLAVAGEARAQNCAKMSGPARTDCFIGRARIGGAQSDIAAGEARVRTSAERLRAVTGGSFEPRRLKVKSKHRAGRRY
jgi:hypothetical protein